MSTLSWSGISSSLFQRPLRKLERLSNTYVLEDTLQCGNEKEKKSKTRTFRETKIRNPSTLALTDVDEIFRATLVYCRANVACRVEAKVSHSLYADEKSLEFAFLKAVRFRIYRGPHC